MRFMFIIAIIIIQFIIFAGHYIAYRGIVDMFQIKDVRYLFWLKIILITLSLSFVVASLISSKFFSSFTQIFYTASAIWLGTLFYIVCACALFLAIKFGTSSFISIHALSVMGKLLLLIGISIGVYGIWNAQTIRVNCQTVSIPKIPEQWKGKTMLWVSDIHFGQVYSTRYSKRLASIIQNEHPDILIFGGDVFDGTASDIKNVLEPLSHIKTKWGTYFITGNHEEFSDDETFINAVKNSGIAVLQNNATEIDGVNIIGVDYRNSEEKNTFKTTLETLIKSEESNILLKHSPTNLDIASAAGIALQISGHTHVAQMTPFTYITKAVYNGFDYGIHQYKNMEVITSSGVGTWGPPLRVGTKSEIVRITF